MSGDFTVNHDALETAAERVSQTADDLSNQSLEKTIAEAGAGLAGSQTAPALSEVAVLLASGVLAYSEAVAHTANSFEKTNRTYQESDQDVAGWLKRLVV